MTNHPPFPVVDELNNEPNLHIIHHCLWGYKFNNNKHNMLILYQRWKNVQ